MTNLYQILIPESQKPILFFINPNKLFIKLCASLISNVRLLSNRLHDVEIDCYHFNNNYIIVKYQTLVSDE